MKIAIVGSGISGLTAALLLQDKHDITIFEAESWVGGHSHTVSIKENSQLLNIDTGFIVCNNKNYPNFLNLLKYLQVPLQNTSMSFSVCDPKSNLEYNGTSINGLFAQRKNLLSFNFLCMLKDIMRFNTVAKDMAKLEFQNISLKDFITPLALRAECLQHYLLPMIAAIWSSDVNSALSMPAWFICKFLDNHGMLNINDRPQWYSIAGGSQVYVAKLCAILKNPVQTNNAVKSLVRSKEGVVLFTKDGEQKFDQVIIATHSDTALSLLSDANALEQIILKKMRYVSNEVVLHTDIDLLPKNRRAWACWNYRVMPSNNNVSLVTYNMNMLQNLQAQQTYCVSLNQTRQINENKILARFDYAHPVFDQGAIDSQNKIAQISGVRNTYFCGAYWGYGFHEDGVKSGINVAKQIDKDIAWTAPFTLV